jgi:RNA polymerase sigma-70 factor (ECF subfamily)
MGFAYANYLSFGFQLALELKNFFWFAQAGNYHKTRDDIERELTQIRRAQDNPQEFAPIYNRYYNAIFIYISKRIDDLDLVAEVTSRTFTKCLTNLHKFKFMGVPFSAWLYKIAINEVRLFYRSRKSHPRTISLSENEFRELQEETIEEEQYAEAHKILPKLLARLSEAELQMVELRFFEKKSFKDIGFVMGLSEVNAKVKTYRILKKLKMIAQGK